MPGSTRSRGQRMHARVLCSVSESRRQDVALDVAQVLDLGAGQAGSRH